MTCGPKAKLVLSDGTIFQGHAFGHISDVSGEVVFNTGMTGYQEILTDPSYKGQIVVMTYPLIGNYGVNTEDFESRIPFVEGFVVRELSALRSNPRSSEDLEDFMKRHAIMGIQGVDTRAMTKRLRMHGSMNGLITTMEWPDEILHEKVRTIPSLEGRDLVQFVTCRKRAPWTDGMRSRFSPKVDHAGQSVKHRVAVMDFGVKYSILRHLTERGCQVQVYPADTRAQDVLASDPDGIFLSNGPGDPAAVTYAVETVRQLMGTVPMFGICLGHQILALALGAKTYKLKFGHHGCNHPVMNLATDTIEITSQNHGFAVCADSLKERGVQLTHVNLNDQTVEGLEQSNLNVFSVQYHPESSPGPHDSAYLFDRFVTLIKNTT